MFKYHAVRDYKGPAHFATTEDGLKIKLHFLVILKF